MFSMIRVELDVETLRRLRRLAADERRSAADQAAVVLTKALARRRPRPTPTEGEPEPDR
ncbi:MAG: hypothetical protein IT341_09285 [Chloroflexi bacterium]|nr:hypothetical protein [Chloroflexota bacterium]